MSELTQRSPDRTEDPTATRTDDEPRDDEPADGLRDGLGDDGLGSDTDLGDDAPGDDEDDEDAEEPAAGDLDDGGPDNGGDPEDTTASTARPRRSSAWIAWTVAVAMAVVAGWSVAQWRSLAGPVEASDAATDAAVGYVETLTNWDAATGLEDTYQQLVDAATDGVVQQLQSEIFGPDQREQLVQIEAESTGTIIDVATSTLQPGDPPSVVVLVVLEHTQVSGPTDDPIGTRERVARLRMIETDRGWLVDDLELVAEFRLSTLEVEETP